MSQQEQVLGAFPLTKHQLAAITAACRQPQTTLAQPADNVMTATTGFDVLRGSVVCQVFRPCRTHALRATVLPASGPEAGQVRATRCRPWKWCFGAITSAATCPGVAADPERRSR
jgi:hypothetical protein